MQSQSTATPSTARTPEDRRRRRKALLAWGSIAGVAALTTTAAFTDVARLNIGASGLGGADSAYNLQVGATDANGAFIAGQWQEADGPEGVPIALLGARPLAPGSGQLGVNIPVRNDSPTFGSTVTLSVDQLPDDVAGDRVTDPRYRSSLRFQVTMGGTSAGTTFFADGLTFEEVQDLELNGLAAGEEGYVVVAVNLLSQAESGASHTDDELNGAGAYLQLRLDGASV